MNAGQQPSQTLVSECLVSRSPTFDDSYIFLDYRLMSLFSSELFRSFFLGFGVTTIAIVANM